MTSHKRHGFSNHDNSTVFFPIVCSGVHQIKHQSTVFSMPWCHHLFKLCPNFPPSLQWHHNESDGVSNHQPQDCLLNRLFKRRSKKTWKLRVTGLCEGNSPETGEFPTQRASNAEMFPFDDVIVFVSILVYAISSFVDRNVTKLTTNNLSKSFCVCCCHNNCLLCR